MGTDIAGVAVRMIRKTSGNQETKQQAKRSIALFIFAMRLTYVPEIRQFHFDRFADILSRIPKAYWKSKRHEQMTIQELLADADLYPDKPRGLSRDTVEKHCSIIRDVLAKCQREGSGTFFEPEFRSLLPIDDRDDSEKQATFTLADLRSVFEHTIWRGHFSKGRLHVPGEMVIKNHHYWVPLLLAYTGARRSEVAGLLTTDVGHEDGIPYLYIRPNHLRGLKNTASKRRIPIHPHLVELGFLDFVQSVRTSKLFALFPAAIPKKLRILAKQPNGPEANYDKKFGDSLHHVWFEALKHALNGNPENYVMHSMRHYANDHFINLRAEDGISQLIPEVDRRDILGHTHPNVNERTYRRPEKPLGPLYEAIKLLPQVI
jgi:uncharacterized membrane-anchored protein YhcB (DUF1043 family)